ncbi:MAG: Hpt domain-containing protein [Egibacteraceae bacterium]
MLCDLEEALAGEDARQVEPAAHALKGAALNVGAERLGAACALVEDHARHDRVAEAAAGLADARDEVGALDPVLARLAAELDPSGALPSG